MPAPTPTLTRAMAALFHSIAAICACLSVPKKREIHDLLNRAVHSIMVIGNAPETWITCGTTLPSSLFPILSRSTSAAQVVRAASPRATRMIQRCVVGEKYLTACREKRAVFSVKPAEGNKTYQRANRQLLPSPYLQSSLIHSVSAR